MTAVSKIKKGDLLALTYYVKALSPVRNQILPVEDVDRKGGFRIEGNDLIETVMSADQFTKTERKTKTELAEILIGVEHMPFTVCYDKQDGKERVLRGRLLKHEKLLGRSQVHDLDIAKGNPMRLVDHRTLKWIIVDGVKHVLKK